MSEEKALLIADVQRRICQESIPRINKCIELLNDEEIWSSLNEASNSVAQLILHLNGNVRQWIFSGLLGDNDLRDRKGEFSANNSHNKNELRIILSTLSKDLNERLPALLNVDLTVGKTIQGIQENGVSILVHVVEHFSYHTGQIALLTKTMKNKDLGFYGNGHLNDLNP